MSGRAHRPSEVEETRLETDYKRITVKSKPISAGYVKNKILLVNE